MSATAQLAPTGGHVSGARTLVFLAVAAGIWASFAWWSVLQEKLLTRPYSAGGAAGGGASGGAAQTKFYFPFFLNLVSYVACVVLAVVLFAASRAVGAGTPLMRVDAVATCAMGFSLSLGTPFGYAAMRRISYPIVLTAKMCKPIPTMLIGFVWFGQRYSLLKSLAVMMLTFGVLGFSLFDGAAKAGGAATSLVGLGLCACNLLFDGYTQSAQDSIIATSRAGSLQMMALANGFAAASTAVLLALGEVLPVGVPVLGDLLTPREFSNAVAFLNAYPDAGDDLLYMALLGALGQVFIFWGISYFGTLTVIGLTVSRKIGSVMLSIWMHNHSITHMQSACLAVLVVGILLDAYIGIREKSKHRHHHPHSHHDSNDKVAAVDGKKDKKQE